MNARVLKIALAVSVALNLFAAAAAVTTWVARSKVEHRVEAQGETPRRASFRQMLARMDPDVRERVRGTFHASALAARPDFEEAREARREAVALTAAPTFDAAQVTALLDKSRAAEIRGRTRLEADAVQLLSTLDADDRAALAPIFSRRGGRSSHSGGGEAAKPATPAPARQTP